MPSQIDENRTGNAPMRLDRPYILPELGGTFISENICQLNISNTKYFYGIGKFLFPSISFQVKTFLIVFVMKT